MSKDIVVLVGNGFNYMLNDFIKNEYYNEGGIYYNFNKEDMEKLTSDIEQITRLWEKFDDFFKNLGNEYTEYNSEELIKMVYSVLDFLANADDISKFIDGSSRRNLYELKSGLQRCITDKIVQISEEFIDFERRGGYGEVKRIYPDFGKEIQEILNEKNVERSYFVTTNYDGIFLDTLLCENKSWFFSDGFAGRDELSYYEPYLRKDHIRAHLHGSYRFYYDGLETLKLAKGEVNNRPVMIFNQPDLKKKQIDHYNILREYYNELRGRLIESNKLFIIGNSLRNEPHIRNLIKKHFNNDNNEIYIFDKDPDNVEEELKNHPMRLKMIIKKIYSDDLYDINYFLNEFSNMLD